MKEIDLQERLAEIFKNIINGKIDKEVYEWSVGNKYSNIKPYVTVHVGFKSGQSAKIDITDYFKEEIK